MGAAKMNPTAGDGEARRVIQPAPRGGVTRAGAATFDSDCVRAILRAAYRIARNERQRIQADLDLLVGIARALEAGIYEPTFALERAVEHGLVAWRDFEFES